MKVVNGGVTKPAGFLANGLSCGIKRSGKPDLSLIFSTVPAVTVGVFTKNSIKAAPLILSQKHLKDKKARAIICNSGNANCYTGRFGHLYAKQTVELIGKLLDIKPSEVVVSSTGIIGKPLPYKKIEKAAPQLVNGLRKSGGTMAAKGILTTDLVKKECAVTLTIGGKKVTIGACAKGSGMIEPNMATMLGFITTDAAINPSALQKALREAVELTFNSITVDGCMSTNDMVTLTANGLARNPPISAPGEDYRLFVEALTCVCMDLAKKIVKDGEGATKFIEVEVKGAKDYRQAKAAAMKIANSNLVKTAAYGSNPNWGRVGAAVGSLGLKVTEETLKIRFSSFKKKNIRIEADLNLGKASAVVYTSDLSLDYVRINGKYN